MATDFPRITVTNLDTGRDFEGWESVTVTQAFLTPCGSFQLEASSEQNAIDLARSLAADAKVRIKSGDDTLITGYVDECAISVSRSGGHKVAITGRDVLGPVVDGNVDPRMQVSAQTTIGDLCAQVITEQFKIPIGFDQCGVDVALRSKVGAPPDWNQSKHKRKTPIKDAKPRDSEGAFGYLARILAHYGYWIWSSWDGEYAVIAGPEYNQSPCYAVTLIPGSSKTNVLSATSTTSTKSVPSHVFVRGTDASKGQKGAVVGMGTFPLARRFKPVYISDSQAGTQEKAERIAAQFLARKKKDFFHYECEVVGHQGKGPGGEGIWRYNTVVEVRDDVCGVDGQMWIESVVYKQSRSGGTTTDLKLIPLNTLLLDVPEGENAPKFSTYGQVVITESSAPVLSKDFTVETVSFNKK